MTQSLGDFPVDAAVTFLFTTHAATGAAVAPLSAFEIADVRIYKNSSATQRTSSSGMTMTSPFDSVTGLHCVEIDLTDNTDAGFFAVGNQYHVVLVPDTETVDGQTVVSVLATFGITVNSATILADAVNTKLGTPPNLGSGATFGDNSTDIWNTADSVDGTLGASGSGLTAIPWNAAWDAEVQSEAADAITAAALATAADLATLAGYVDTEVAAILAAVDTEVAAILADTNELQTDLVNGGRLDLLIDAIKAKTDALPSDPADQSAVEAAITAATSSLATAANLATLAGYVDTEVAAIKGVTDKLDTAIVMDGAVYQFTANALELAPTGGSAPSAADIRAEIDANSTQLAAILEDTGTTLPASLATVAGYLDTEVAAILAAVDTEVAAIKAKTDNLPASPAAVGSEMVLTVAYDAAKTAATQTSVNDLPTNAELATALAGADDTVLAAVAALNNLSSAQAQTAAAAALTAYDPPTNAEMVARTLLAADYTVVSDLGTVQTGDSYARLGAPAGASIAADIAGISAGTAPTVEDIDTRLSTTHGAGSWLSGGGSGTGSYTDTITDGANPLDGVRVQLSTDVAGTNRVYETFTDALGVFALSPDPGTYYRWLDLAGYTFTQGVEFMVT